MYMIWLNRGTGRYFPEAYGTYREAQDACSRYGLNGYSEIEWRGHVARGKSQ
jgi:hypothetical protein